MSKFRRVCINLPTEIEQELRVLHADMIVKTRKNISFSKFFSYLIRETLSEKRAQQWYGDHDCTVVNL